MSANAPFPARRLRDSFPSHQANPLIEAGCGFYFVMNDDDYTEKDEATYWVMNQKAKQALYDHYLRSPERMELMKLATNVKYPLYP